MAFPIVGLDLHYRPSPGETIQAIQQSERLGVPMIWSTTGRGYPDPLTLYAAALVKTDHIGFGTAITPTYPRHPANLAAQVVTLDQLAPGRFRLGIGTSHRPTIEGAYGIPMGKPHEHLREYLTVLRALLHDGEVDFDGTRYQAHLSGLRTAPDVPIYLSALRPRAFELAGELADGAISWVCPLAYLRQEAVPAMRRAADRAGRDVPRMVAHVPVVMTTDRAIMRQSARRRLATYGRLEFYAKMFALAGYPVPASGEMSDELLDHLVVSGGEGEVGERLSEMLAAGSGIDELLVMLIATSSESGNEEQERLSRVLAAIAGNAG